MKLGAFLKQYLKQSLQVFKHPKQMLPTIILTVVWIILGILQIKLKENLPMKLLNFLTYAQGGLYGGIFGAIGGILGKVVVAAFVNALIVPLFMGKKPFAAMEGGWKELLQNIGFQSKSALAPLLKGFGAAMLIYILFNTTARFENSMAGIMAAVSLALAMGKKSGFMWELAISYANSVSKGRKLNYQSILRALTGMTLGFALAVALTVVAPSLVSLLGIVALIVGWIMGKGSKKEAVSTMAVVLLCLLPQWEMKAQENYVPSRPLTDQDMATINAFRASIPDAPTGSKGDNSEGVWVLKDIKTEVKSSGTGTIWSTTTSVSNLQITDNTNISFDFREETANGKSGHCTSTISSVKGPYAPGEELCMNFSGSKEHSVITAFGHICALWDNVHGPDNAVIKQAYCCLTFPSPDDAPGGRYEFTFTVTILDAYVSMKYIFEWDESTIMSLADYSDLTWKLFGGDGEHAPEEWTILIAIIGGLGGLIGAGAGGGIGGAAGGIPGGSGDAPIEMNELTPEELEWMKWVREREKLKQKYVHDNQDGTRTVTDPATGKTQTFYPSYGKDGEEIAWKNENDTVYSDDQLGEWLGDREANAGMYRKMEEEIEKTRIADMEAFNKANEDARKEAQETGHIQSPEARRYRAERDARNAQYKKDDYIEKLHNNYYLEGAPEAENIKKAILQEKEKADTELAEAQKKEARMNVAIAVTGVVETAADTTIAIGATIVPGGKAIQAGYLTAKGGMSRAAESQAQGNGGFSAKTMAATAFGLLEGALDAGQNYIPGGNTTKGIIASAGGKMGTTAVRQVLSGIYEGESASEIAKRVVVKVGTQGVSLGVGGTVRAAGVVGQVTEGVEDNAGIAEALTEGFTGTIGNMTSLFDNKIQNRGYGEKMSGGRTK